MSTFFQRREDALTSAKWHVVDATDIPLGRLASAVATLIRGKHKATFTPHVDCGDFVVVVNASKVKLTGKKAERKVYYKHTGYIGGLKTNSAGDLRENNPERLISEAVRGMLPKGNLGHGMRNKLRVFAGGEHTHQAQLPQEYSIS